MCGLYGLAPKEEDGEVGKSIRPDVQVQEEESAGVPKDTEVEGGRGQYHRDDRQSYAILGNSTSFIYIY